MIFPVWVHAAALAVLASQVIAIEPQEFSAEDKQCMIDNVFYEGASEPELGHILIVQTVKNRTANPKRWGNTICETIYERAQFSWTFIPAYKLWAFKNDPDNADEYAAIVENIDNLLSAPTPVGFEGVTHYLRCDSKSPEGWEDDFVFLGQVGAHCFYREE